MWAVDDASSVQLMNTFYEKLAEGLPKDVALRLAKLEFLAKAPITNLPPFYWGALGVIGDSKPLAVNATWYSSEVWWLLGFILIIFLFSNRKQRKPAAM